MPPPHFEALQEQADAVQRVLVEGLDAAEQEPLQALLAKLLGVTRANRTELGEVRHERR